MLLLRIDFSGVVAAGGVLALVFVAGLLVAAFDVWMSRRRGK